MIPGGKNLEELPTPSRLVAASRVEGPPKSDRGGNNPVVDTAEVKIEGGSWMIDFVEGRSV